MLRRCSLYLRLHCLHFVPVRINWHGMMGGASDEHAGYAQEAIIDKLTKQ